MIKAKNFFFASDDELFNKAKKKNIELYNSLLDGTTDRDKVYNALDNYSILSGRKTNKVIFYKGFNELKEDLPFIKALKKESSNKFSQHPNFLYPFERFGIQLRAHLGISWNFISTGKSDPELESFYRPGLIDWIKKIRFLSILRSYQRPIHSFQKINRLTTMYKYTKPDMKYLLLYNFFKDLEFPLIESQLSMLELANIISKETYHVVKYSDNYLVIERPKIKYMKHQETELSDVDLHCTNGPAMIFNDGSRFSYFHGQFLDNWIWDMEDSRKKVRKILRINDVDLRKHAIDYMGKDKFLSYLDSRVVDKKGDYELALLQVSRDIQAPYLIMKNPSTGEEHIEGVHPDIRTVDEALGWRLGLKVFIKPNFTS